MNVLQQLRDYLPAAAASVSSVRLPFDLTRLWRARDEGDAATSASVPEKTFFETMEPYLVRMQELSLWTDPRQSAIAILAFHVVHQHLLCLVLGGTVLSALATVVLTAFVSHTWFYRVWPEIRVEDPEEDRPENNPEFTPMRPECLTAPEMNRAWQDATARLGQICSRASDARRSSPGRFCACASAFFLATAYLGTFVTVTGLTYWLGIAYLTLPGLMEALKDHPVVQCFKETVLNLGGGLGGGGEDETDGKAKLEEEDEKGDQEKKEEGGGAAAAAAGFTSEYVYSSLQEKLAQTSTYVSDNLSSAVSTLLAGPPGAVKEEAEDLHRDDAKKEDDDLDEYLPIITREPKPSSSFPAAATPHNAASGDAEMEIKKEPSSVARTSPFESTTKTEESDVSITREDQGDRMEPLMPSPEELDPTTTTTKQTSQEEDDDDDDDDDDDEFLPTDRQLPSLSLGEDVEGERSDEDEAEPKSEVFDLAFKPPAVEDDDEDDEDEVPVGNLIDLPVATSTASAPTASQSSMPDVDDADLSSTEEEAAAALDPQTRQAVMLRSALKEEKPKSRTPSHSSEENDEDFELITEEELKKAEQDD